jgi:uncharacterized membrane protein (DUF2068 family)
VTTRRSRPSGLLFLIIYKSVSAIVLFVVAAALITAFVKRGAIEDTALEPHRFIVQLLLEKILNISPKSLQFGAIGTFIYGLIAGIEAIGLWFEQSWASWLILLSVGLSIPIEIFELVHHMTGLKWLLFVINLVVFWYVLTHLPKHHGAAHHRPPA